MKKLLLVPLMVLLFGLGYFAHKTPTKVVSQTTTVTNTVYKQVAQPTYHIGDAQGGITLTHFYAFATPTAGIVPGGYKLVAAELSGISLDSNSKLALIYADNNQYLQPHGDTVTECSNCAVFLVPKGVAVDTFIYKDYKWLL